MKPIYIILTQSRSIVAKTIKKATKRSYNHCSIAFDSSLPEMYSMGRIYPNNPLLGGLVIEKINQGTYKKFDDTVCAILEVYVEDNQLEVMKSQVHKMLQQQKNYKYNYVGLFAGAAGITYQSQNRFYCSEFVRFILVTGGIDIAFLPSIVQPTDFFNFPKHKIVYKGLLKQANIKLSSDTINKHIVRTI